MMLHHLRFSMPCFHSGSALGYTCQELEARYITHEAWSAEMLLPLQTSQAGQEIDLQVIFDKSKASISSFARSTS